MQTPRPRGPVSAAMLGHLTADPHAVPATLVEFARQTSADGRVAALSDEVLQVSLWICYELSYRGFEDVDDVWETEPSLIAVRQALEERFVAALAYLTGSAPRTPVEPGEVAGALGKLIEADDGPPLARYLQRSATAGQFAEFVAHRSVYHLKEADPHSWAIPRIGGRAKAALVEIEADEYGGGRFEAMHSELFRTMMRGLGLDDTYGAYVDQVPAVTLAVSNTMSLFGSHRRWTPALLGHLAVLELTSSLPNRRYGNGLRRLGHGSATTEFYDEHVEADAVHEQIAAHDLCDGYALDHPETTGDILFGAACALAVDNAVAAHLLSHWKEDLSTLRSAASVG